MKIGIPRSLTYHFYGSLWLDFFANLGVEVVLSPKSNKLLVKRGSALSVDETCYPAKIYLGHVEYLLDKCDMIFVPRIECSGIREEFCMRFFGLVDLVKSTFPNVKILHTDTNYLFRKKELDGFLSLAAPLGKTREETLAAYEKALDAFNGLNLKKIEKQTQLLSEDGTKILIVSHAYNTFDAMIGEDIISYFTQRGIKLVYADIADAQESKQKTKELYGNRIYWKINSELIGGVEFYKDKVDGIVLLSAFPCGPDSITNELILRSTFDKPVLQLIIDEQNASAGVLTRLESFMDIIEAKKRGVKYAN